MEPGRTRRANRRGLEPRDERRPEVLRKTTSARGTMPSTNGHPNQWRERNWLPKRNPITNTRTENSGGPRFSEVLTKRGNSDLRPALALTGETFVDGMPRGAEWHRTANQFSPHLNPSLQLVDGTTIPIGEAAISVSAIVEGAVSAVRQIDHSQPHGLCG